MKFDTVIIGGGLAGLTAGLRLQQKGKSVAIVSAGQNALHFSSGTFGVLNEGAEIPENHPYMKLNLEGYLAEVIPFFASAGVVLKGNPLKNSWRITPMGKRQEARFFMEDADPLEGKDTLIGKKALVVSFPGFLDFNTSFLAASLEKSGTAVRIELLALPEMDRLRENPSEMRSVNVARVMDRAWNKVVSEVKLLLKGEDVIVLPQVFGLKDSAIVSAIRESFDQKVLFVGTMPPSVPGMRTQMKLKQSFEAAGGTFLMGDEVLSAEISSERVVSVKTRNLGDHALEADAFILASGSYFSKGLSATTEEVFEPLFGLDVNFSEGRSSWYDADFYSAQPFNNFGVMTDEKFRALKEGKPVLNLYAAGSVLGGADALRLGCGAGVAILSGLAVADAIAPESK
ncbi:MAG: anaerobic glycerol-3-phosphate dehydrogenase subunit B [Bacteroidales bacterium]|nr:anaerobic glycerol-3-phosphate dehydrogenase subunit B [Bacteroidales bacterium]